MSTQITAYDIHEMVMHWLNTPVNGYLGSGYGSDIKALLQTAMNSGRADEFIAKMRNDIPVLNLLPDGAISIGFTDAPPDQKRLAIQVAGQTFVIDA